MSRSGYVEIRSPERVRVIDFINSSPAYHGLITIPSTKLSRENKGIIEGLCDPLTFAELEEQFKKIVPATDTLACATQNALRFFVSFLDDNEKFQYYFIQLKAEYEAWKVKSEKTPLL